METIAIVVPICSVVVSVITMLVAYFAYKRNKSKDDKEENEKKGVLYQKVGDYCYIGKCEYYEA